MASESVVCRPRLAVYKLASCDGCQLSVLSCEEELLALGERVDVVHFAEATSRPDDGAPFDVCLVEGSVSTPEQLELVHTLRQRSRTLVAIGACATAAGIQGIRNWADPKRYLDVVYPEPSYVRSLDRVSPISAHVPVDFELAGCPIDKQQLLEVITARLVGRSPAIRDESVCMECKRKGYTCVLVTGVAPCLGPVTRAGCGALCPRFARGCYGCFGPREGANTKSLDGWDRAQGVSPESIVRRYRTFNCEAQAFRQAGDRAAADCRKEGNDD